MRGREGSGEWDEFASFLTLVAGIVVIGLAVTLLVRLERGLLGVLLSGVAVILLVFWLKEVRGFLRRRPWILEGAGGGGAAVPEASRPDLKEELWTYDLFETDGERVLVAKVPGPEEDVKVNLSDNRLQITGGRGFTKKLAIPGEADISRITYKNGVLEVRFRKKGRPVEGFQGKDGSPQR